MMVLHWFYKMEGCKVNLLYYIAACRIQARVRGFAVRQMLSRPTPAPSLFGAEFEGVEFCIAGNDDDDSDATIPFPEDDEDLFQLGLVSFRGGVIYPNPSPSSATEPEVDQAHNDDDREVTQCESYNNAGVSVGQLLGLVAVFGVGAAVGDLLGPAVGFAVGTFVGGIVEHAAGGAAVGDWLGIEIVLAVGAAVGDLLGPAAGIAFGTVVGGTVGPSAGAVFGALVGNLLSTW